MIRRIAPASLALLLMAASPSGAAQQPLVLDLGGPSVQTMPGSGKVTFKIINRVPVRDYITAVVDRIIPIDGFTPITGGGPAGVTTDPCTDLLAKATKLSLQTGGPKDEAEVKATVAAIEGDLSSCTDAAITQQIRAQLVRTTLDVPGSFTVAAGHEIILTVIRAGDPKLKWTLTVQGESRGKWLTMYGMAFGDNREHKYFAKGTGTQFTVTREHDARGFKPLPSVFFTWLSRSRQDRNVAFGPTAGFGIEGGNRPALFGGFAVTYNWNLGLVAGVAMTPELRLNGRYTEGEVIPADPGESGIHSSSVRPRMFLAFIFRFGSNPFVTAPAVGK